METGKGNATYMAELSLFHGLPPPSPTTPSLATTTTITNDSGDH
jgi:hypothetical protein